MSPTSLYQNKTDMDITNYRFEEDDCTDLSGSFIKLIIEFCVQGLRVSEMNFDKYKKEGFETNLVLELCKKEL